MLRSECVGFDGPAVALVCPYIPPPGVRLSSDVRFQPSSEPIDYRHTATPGRELALSNQSVDYIREMHERFDRLKANTYTGPTRTMAEALAGWGVALPPRAAL